MPPAGHSLPGIHAGQRRNSPDTPLHLATRPLAAPGSRSAGPGRSPWPRTAALVANLAEAGAIHGPPPDSLPAGVRASGGFAPRGFDRTRPADRIAGRPAGRPPSPRDGDGGGTVGEGSGATRKAPGIAPPRRLLPLSRHMPGRVSDDARPLPGLDIRHPKPHTANAASGDRAPEASDPSTAAACGRKPVTRA